MSCFDGYKEYQTLGRGVGTTTSQLGERATPFETISKVEKKNQ
jgi:hypothetical protein